MKDKFIQYLEHVGERYAITYAKYERINLTLVQLWYKSYDKEANLDKIARIYKQV